MGATDESTSPATPTNTTSNILDDLGSLSLSTSPPHPAQAALPPPQNHLATVNPIASPPAQNQSDSFAPLGSSPPAAAPANNMNDLLGLFGGGEQNNGVFAGSNVWNDIPQPQKNKTKSNEDILGLF